MAKNNADFNGKNNPNYRTGYAAAVGKRKSVYTSWQNMKQRCLNPKNPKYKNYGGRGIKVCDAWLGFENFLQWSLDNGWVEGLSIDRIDVDGDYCPENCRWITISKNSKCRTNNKLSVDDVTRIRLLIKKQRMFKDIANKFNVTPQTISHINTGRTHRL